MKFNPSQKLKLCLTGSYTKIHGRSDLFPKFETLFEKGLLHKNPRETLSLDMAINQIDRATAALYVESCDLLISKIQRHEWKFTKKTSIAYHEQSHDTLTMLLKVMDVAKESKMDTKPHCSFKKEISKTIGKAGPGNNYWKQSTHGMLAHRLYDQLFKIYKNRSDIPTDISYPCSDMRNLLNTKARDMQFVTVFEQANIVTRVQLDQRLKMQILRSRVFALTRTQS